MDLRASIMAATKQAMKDKAANRLSTLRLISAAIKDRDIAARAEGNDEGVGDDELLAILGKMTRNAAKAPKPMKRLGVSTLPNVS